MGETLKFMLLGNTQINEGGKLRDSGPCILITGFDGTEQAEAFAQAIFEGRLTRPSYVGEHGEQ